MFRSAEALREDALIKRFEGLRQAYVTTLASWYDGTPQSIDRRLEQTKTLLGYCHEAVRNPTERTMEITSSVGLFAHWKRVLEAEQQRLLTAGSWYTGPEDPNHAVGDMGPNDFSSRDEYIRHMNMRNYLQHQTQQHGGDYPVDESWRNPHDPYSGESHLYPGMSADSLAHPPAPSSGTANPDASPGGWGPGGRNGKPPRAIGPGGVFSSVNLEGKAQLQFRQAARAFLAEQNTTDRHELLMRAQRHAEAQTGTWSREGSARAVRAFLETVDGMIPPPQRVAARQAEATVEDFDDVLMFS